MRAWTRAVIAHRCGWCGKTIEMGQPLLVVTLPAVQRKRYRCVACEGPAPPELPAEIEQEDFLFEHRLARLAGRLLPFRREEG